MVMLCPLDDIFRCLFLIWLFVISYGIRAENTWRQSSSHELVAGQQLIGYGVRRLLQANSIFLKWADVAGNAKGAFIALEDRENVDVVAWIIRVDQRSLRY